MEATTYVTLTEEELDARLADAAAEGAKQAVAQLREDFGALDRHHRMQVGLITLQDIADVYAVSGETVRNWGVEPIEYEGRANLYRVEEIERHISE